MGDKLNHAEREEAKEIIGKLTVTGARLADLALDNLDTRANPVKITESTFRLDTLTQRGAQRLKGIHTRFSQIQTNPKALEAYTLDAFKTDFRFFIRFLTPPLRPEYRNKINQVTPEKFAKIKAKLKTAQEQREKQKEEAAAAKVEKTESLGMTPQQVDFLVSPKLELATLIKDVNAEVPNASADVKMTRLREKMTTKVLTGYNQWAEKFRETVGKDADGSLAEYEKQLAHKEGDIKATSDSLIGKTAKGGGNLLESGFGDIQQLWHVYLHKDPFLKTIFVTKGAMDLAYGHANSGTEEVSRFISHQVQEMTGNLSFENLEQEFEVIPDDPAEMSPDQLRAMHDKMETVPKFFRNKDFANKYYDYLRTAVGGDLKLALDFDDWFDTLEMNMWVKMFYQVMMMIPDELIDWFDGSEKNKTDAQKNGEKLQALKNELGERGEKTDTDDLGTPATEKDVVNDGRYKNLLNRFQELKGSDSASMNIIVGEKKLEESNLTQDQIEGLTSVSAMLKKEPKSIIMLEKDLDLDDVIFVARHLGDQHKDDINVYFNDDSMRLTGEWPIIGLDNDKIDIPYDELTRSFLASAINDVKANEQYEIESPNRIEGLIDFLPNFERDKVKFTDGVSVSKLIEQGEVLPGFQSLLNLGSKFWGTYQMSQTDIDNFVKYQEGFWGNGQFDNELDAFQDKGGQFEVEGSGIWGIGVLDLTEAHYNSVEEFFKDLNDGALQYRRNR